MSWQDMILLSFGDDRLLNLPSHSDDRLLNLPSQSLLMA
jgi:hypothetical protein